MNFNRQEFLLQAFYALIACTFVFIGAYFSSTDQEMLTYYTKEDGFLEWLTFLVFVSSAFLMFVLWLQKICVEKIPVTKFSTLVLLGFAAMFFVAAMEEISWFQRVFNVESGEMFQEMNKQGETNFHNLVVGGVSINKLVFGKILFLFVFIHNLVLPIWGKFNANIYKKVEKLGLFLPPLGYVCFYLLVAILVETSVEHERGKEILETGGSLHYMFSFFSVYFLGYNGYTSILKEQKPKAIAAILFSFFILFLILIALILGAISLG